MTMHFIVTKEQQFVRRIIEEMNQYPCENCSIRKPACQDTCHKLKEHLTKQQNIKEQIKAENRNLKQE